MKKSPFELLHGYWPWAYPAIIGNMNVPTTNACLKALQCARKEAQASLKIVAKAIRIQHDHLGTELPPFKKGDQVWLDGKNIHTDHSSEKLRSKHVGPFEIINTIGTVNFKLKLPKSWKRIHNVFHTSQLMPYKENKVYGPNYPKPAPNLIEGQEEFKVKAIVGAQYFRW